MIRLSQLLFLLFCHSAILATGVPSPSNDEVNSPSFALTGNNQIDLPVTFEDTSVDYTLTDFGGNASSLITDPDDPNNTVVRSVKTPSAQFWAGTSIGTPAGFATPIPFSATETRMHVRIWSPAAGIQIRLKAEDHLDNTITVETKATTTVAGAWEILEFDFSNPILNTPSLNLANTYDLASIFFNFGADGAAVGADSVYYWDDVKFGPKPAPSQIDLPVSFDDSTVNYTLTDFGGNSSSLVADPDDPANTVVRSVKTASAQSWAGTSIGTTDGFATPIPFSATETRMHLRVWSPVSGVQIRLKAEDHTDNTITVETKATTTVAGAWEILEFDFSTPILNTPPLDTANTYDLASIFFNFGADGAAVGADSVYFWDDVAFGPKPTLAQIDLPVSFEDSTVDYTLTDFGGNASGLVPDPDDPTNTVARSVKTASAQTWAGTTIGTPEGFATPIPFSATETRMHLRIWSPAAGIQIRLKAEDHSNNTITVETKATTTVAGAWEILEFDFSIPIINTPPLDPTNTYDLASIFFNFGADGAAVGADSVFLWDDVTFGPKPTLAQIDLPVSFEDSTVDYTVTDFGGNSSSLVTDPNEPTNTVVRSVKTASAQGWAGTSIGTPEGFATPIPFSASETRMHLRVWSPAAGIQIRLKAEDHTDNTITVETKATTTISGAWEFLEFDFSNHILNTPPLNLANTYDLASIFFNFGADGAAVGPDSVYLWDDVMFGPAPSATQISLPVTFEDSTVDYTLTDFGGNSTSLVTDPEDPANTVARSVKSSSAQPWAGTSIGTTEGFSSSVPFTTEYTSMSVRVWSPVAGIPIRLKVEDHTDNTITVETETITTKAGEWETLVFDFANPVNNTPPLVLSNQYDLASIFFNFGTDGSMLGADSVFFWDDVNVITEQSLSQIDLPVRFEDPLTNHTLTDFGGIYTVLTDDPDDPVNTVAKSVKSSSAQSWGGTFIGTDQGFSNPIPFDADNTTMSVRVYSPSAGIPVRMSVEDRSQTPVESVETISYTTLSGTWETMVFDFGTPVMGTPALDFTNTYQVAFIYFNYGVSGSGIGADSVYYWDDVEFGNSTVSIEDFEESAISLSPNPVSTVLTITSQDQLKEILIFNQLGQMVKSLSANSYELEVNVEGLPTGLYTLRIRNQKGSQAFRILKE